MKVEVYNRIVGYLDALTNIISFYGVLYTCIRFSTGCNPEYSAECISYHPTSLPYKNS